MLGSFLLVLLPVLLLDFLLLLPDTEEAVENLVQQQGKVLAQLDSNRSYVLSLLQTGKDLLKDQNAPEFLKKDVASLESEWTNCYSQSAERLKSLNQHLTVWKEYKEKKAKMVALLDETESELSKAMTKPDQLQVQRELKTKEDLKNDLKKATDEILNKMKELTDA